MISQEQLFNSQVSLNETWRPRPLHESPPRPEKRKGSGSSHSPACQTQICMTCFNRQVPGSSSIVLVPCSMNPSHGESGVKGGGGECPTACQTSSLPDLADNHRSTASNASLPLVTLFPFKSNLGIDISSFSRLLNPRFSPSFPPTSPSLGGKDVEAKGIGRLRPLLRDQGQGFAIRGKRGSCQSTRGRFESDSGVLSIILLLRELSCKWFVMKTQVSSNSRQRSD